MASLNRGHELLSLFTRTGCIKDKEKVTGEDFDWLWETTDASTREFLEWVCKNIHSENMLTENELLEWEELKSRSPESILHGQALQEALLTLKPSAEDGSEIFENDPEEFERQFSMLRDKLDATQGTLHDLQLVNNNLNALRTKLSLTLGKINARKDDLQRDVLSKQHKIIECNEDLKQVLNRLISVIIDLQSFISGKRSPGEERCLYESDLEPIFREDEKILSRLDQLIRDHIASEANGLKRAPEDFERLIDEVDRIRFSYAEKEFERCRAEAELAGTKAGCLEIENQLQILKQGKFPKDSTVVENSIQKLESTVLEFSRKITSFQEDIIPKLIDKKVEMRCKEILAADLQAKKDRQIRSMSDLDSLLDFLLDIIAVQEILGGLLQQEVEAFSDLQNQFENLATLQQKMEAEHENDLQLFSAAKERRLKLSRKTVHQNDVIATTVSKIIGANKIDPSLLTLSDVLNSVKSLKEETEALQMKVIESNGLVEEEQKKLNSVIAKLQRELHIGSDELSSGEVSARVHQAIGDVRGLESSGRRVMESWDAAKKSLKENPILHVERSIWKDYLTQPEFLGRNIQAVAESRKMQQK